MVEIFNMHTMYAYCPDEVAKRNIKYAYSTFTSSVDSEAERIRSELTDFLSKNIFGIGNTESLMLNSGSEANEIALFLAKRRTGRSIVVSSNLAHSSVGYSAKKLDLESKVFAVDATTFQVSENDLLAYLEENGDKVAMLNATYGTTQLGTTEDFILSPRVREVCKSKGIGIHIDAAFGAFYLHQIGEVPPEWQKVFAEADSITVDPFKFVGFPTLGIVILKDPNYRALLDGEVTYFKGITTALGTTRSVMPAACALDIIKELGVGGLRKLSSDSLAKAHHITDELGKDGVEFLSDKRNVVVAIKMPDESALTSKLDALYGLGFYLSSVKIKSDNYDLFAMRIVTTPKPEMTLENIDRFITAFRSLK